MRRSQWAAVLSGAAVLAISATCLAEPATSGALQIGVGFRYGIDMNDADVNQWGTGLGLEIGYTLPEVPIYLGGNAEYFFGEKVEGPGLTAERNIWQLSAEGGYDIGAGPVVIRPKLGLGLANSSGERCLGGVCGKTSGSDFMAAPGATFMLMPAGFTLSLDARYALVFAEETEKALILAVGIGF